jgi:hypothetical protein
MKKIILTLAVIAFVFSVNASDSDTEKGVEVKTKNSSNQIKHPKRKAFNGKLVTRADYVKTSNPKRLHWNRIHERNNPIPSNTVSHFHKRRALVQAQKLHRTNVGSPKSLFVQRKRKHS